MRKWLILLLLVIWGYNASGDGVLQKEACRVAINFLNSSGSMSLAERDIKNVSVTYKSKEPLLYLVAFNSGGWVMVSATERVEPVLAYSLKSNFNFQNVPVQFDEWVSGIAGEVVLAMQADYKPDQSLAQKWTNAKSGFLEQPMLKSGAALASVGPLLSSTWDQGKYYNEMAPLDVLSSSDNDHTWIGCVATAMAQIMKFWEYPLSGMGANEYTHDDYGVLAVDFSAATYDWSVMPDHLFEGNTEVQEISYHSAVAVNMDFDPYGSGAFVSNARDAFIKNFKYNSSVYHTWKSDWNDEKWQGLLQAEINKGRPVLYTGYNVDGKSGHAFVCDGYTGDYFHFNWGWGGLADGNFLLSALEPGNSIFNFHQSALFGIEPVKPLALDFPLLLDFESGESNPVSLSGVAMISSDEAHSGSSSLKLSEQELTSNSKNVATLSFVVPDEGKLSFWVKRYSSGISSLNHQSALLMPQWGQNELLTLFSGDYNDDEWVNYTFDIAAYAGQTVRIIFVQQNFDFMRKQWMFIDNIVLTSGDQNLKPFVPSPLLPLLHAEGVELSPVLKWSGGDPNGDSVSYGVYFGANSAPPFLGTFKQNKIEPGLLDHNTTYYWRVVASDNTEQVESDLWNFTTRGIPPDIGMCEISQISDSSANLCGQIQSFNGSILLSKGFYWDTIPDVQKTGHVIQLDPADSFKAPIFGLSPYRQYYAQAFALSNEGEAYSKEVSFFTGAALPEINRIEVRDIRRSSAEVTARVNRMNDAEIVAIGVVWSVDPDFNVDSSHVALVEGNWTSLDTFQVIVKNIPGPVTIYYRSFAVNSAGIGYSDESKFETFNTPPFLDLDDNNSTGASNSNYLGNVFEQGESGLIADDDLVLTDFDMDSIVRLELILFNQVEDESEYLIFHSSDSLFSVVGNYTDTLFIKSTKKLACREWENAVRSVSLWIGSDAPNTSLTRDISVMVNDGYNDSNVAIARIKVHPVNDAPVALVLPELSEEPVFNHWVKVKRGIWSDDRDKLTCGFQFLYQWQLKQGNEIIDLEGETDSVLFINEGLCAGSIRVVETVIDQNCGGSNSVQALAESEWYEVGKAEQQITFDLSPTQLYTQMPFIMSGVASSGLALMYTINSTELAHISNDTLFLDAVGSAVIEAEQAGNNCYLASEPVKRMLIIEPGVQNILYTHPGVISYSEQFLLNFAESTERLNLQVLSSDSSIAFVQNDTVFIRGVGMVELTFTQSGNEYVSAAGDVLVSLEIVKGDQHIEMVSKGELYYGQSNTTLEFINSSALPYQLASSDSTIIKVVGDSMFSVGVGTVVITVFNSGNDFWNPVSTSFNVELLKGIQLINSPDSINKNYGDEAFSLQIKNNSGLSDFLFDVENEQIANINDQNQIVVSGVGKTTITINQEGDGNWDSISTSTVLVVDKGYQVLEFNQMENGVYGFMKIPLSYSINSGLPVTFESSNEEVAFVQNGEIVLNNAGTTTLSAHQAGNDLWYAASSVSRIFEVEKATQAIGTILTNKLTTNDVISFTDFVSSSGLDISEIISSDASVLEVSEPNLLIKNMGKVSLDVYQKGNENYYPANEFFDFEIAFPLGNQEYNSTDLIFFPNPVSGSLNLTIKGGTEFPVELNIINALGQIQITEQITSSFHRIDCSNIPVGVYFVTLNSEKLNKTEKLIVQ